MDNPEVKTLPPDPVLPPAVEKDTFNYQLYQQWVEQNTGSYYEINY